MADTVELIDKVSSAETLGPVNTGEYNTGYEGVKLMLSAESLHQNRLLKLDRKQQEISHTLSEIKDHLKKCYRHIKNGDKEIVDISSSKGAILKLWEEWKAALKEKDLDEYNSLTLELDKMDFSNLSIEVLDDKLIPELEKIQRFHEYKYQQIPNELRMFIELFTILVEILKEIPKKHAEVISHISRSTTRG